MKTGIKKERKISGKKSPEILVVEDSITQATKIKHLLESHHYKVTVANDGEEAINRLSEFIPSLVITDILMPEMNGYELCKQIKSNKNTEDIPVILLTRLTDPEEIIEGLSCGADSFITKPYNEKHLLSNVAKFFSEGNKEDQKKVPFGVQILFKGKKRLIQAEQQKVIKLILDIYEGAVHQNEKLIQTQEELRLLNGRLESLVVDRTADLSEEIKLSNKITAKLKESEKKYRRIFENVQDLYYETSMEGTILEVSPSIIILSKGQYHREDLIGKLMSDFYSDINERATFISQIKKHGAVSDYEIILKNRDGSQVPCSVSSKICFDAQGRPEKIIGSIRNITDRKQAEEILRESESSLQDAQEIAKMGSWEWDMVTQITKWSDNYFAIHGIKPAGVEPSFELFRSRINPDDVHILDEIHANVIKDKTPSSFELRLIQPDGTIKWIQNNISPVIEHDKVVKLKGVIIDITERKLAEKALRESEEKFRSIMENSADAIFIADQQGKYLYTNKAVTAMLGFTPEEMQGKTIVDLSPPDKTDEYFEVFKKVMNKGKVFTEIELLKKDGNFISTDLNSVLLPGGLIYGSCRDITERKNAEEELQQSFAFSESLLKTIPFGMDIVSETGTILFQSDNFRKIFGEEAIGKKCWEMYRDDKKQCRDCPLIHGITVGDTEVYESHGVLGNRIFEINLTGLIYQGKKAMLEIFQDITDRKENEKELVRAKEKAEESDRLKTAFLNNISHEVRTPLNGILGFAEILSAPDLSDEDKKDSISMLNESSDRLLNTITNYMDISLITVGNLTVYKKDFSPAKTLRKIFENYKPLCSDKKLELSLAIREQDSDISLNSDQEIIEKITCHLLNNAIKFTEKGSISFGYKIQKGELEFFVKDTGIGIGKESFKIVFDNFAKEDRGTLKFTEGSGLGLSIAKGMIQMIGGSIRLESELGAGSCFFFTIPLTKNNETVSFGTSNGKHRKSISRAPILVAEDDEINFLYLKTLLNQNTSAEIIHASNGKEALDIFIQKPDIGLILMDIKMPVMNGIEATQQIKALKKDVIVIAITAYAMAGDEAKILNAGCDSYISKPINKKDLLGKIAEYIII